MFGGFEANHITCTITTHNKSRQLWEIHKIKGSDQTKPQKFLAVDCKTTYFRHHSRTINCYHLTTTSMHFRYNTASTNVVFILHTAFQEVLCQSSAIWVKITMNLWSCMGFLVRIRITFSCATAEMSSLITHPKNYSKVNEIQMKNITQDQYGMSKQKSDKRQVIVDWWT
jgi:hypothetical protein